MTTHVPSLPAAGRTTNPALAWLVIAVLALIGIVVNAALIQTVGAAPNGQGTSAPALFDQANAEARAGKTGPAILDYERARLLNPADPAVAANLETVRERAGLATPTASWLDRVATWGSPNLWAVLGATGLLLAGLGGIAERYLVQGRFPGRLAIVAGVVLLALTGASALAAWQKEAKAVIIAESAPARISPTTVGDVLFKLRAGELARMSGHYDGFVLVRDAAGHSGWVSRQDVSPIISD